MDLRIRLTAAAVAAVILMSSGCAKKPEPETVPPVSSDTSVTEQSVETATESSTSRPDDTDQTTNAIVSEQGNGAYPYLVNNVKLKCGTNVETVIHSYEGVKGLDSGWHGKRWIDVTEWMCDLHGGTISDEHLKCGSSAYRYHEITTKNNVKVTFVPFKELGKKKYDGFDTPEDVPVTLVNVEVTLPGGFKIIITDNGNDEEFDISGSGRGWYMTRDQVAVTEFMLELLEKDASGDPLSDIFEHQTLNGTNTYVF